MKYLIRICQGIDCQNYLSEDLFKHAKKLTAESPHIEVEKRGCMNQCTKAPNAEVVNQEKNESTIYNELNYQKLEELIQGLS